MERIYLLLAALLGAVLVALAGWAESKTPDGKREPWDGRKFLASVLRGLIAAAGFAVKYELAPTFGVIDLIAAFIGGAGVDVLINRVAGAMGNPSFPLRAPPP